MRKRSLLSLALLLLAVTPTLVSQDLQGMGSGGSQQGTADNCGDSLSVADEGCAENLQQNQQQPLQQIPMNGSTVVGPRSLGRSPQSDTPLSGQSNPRDQQRPQRLPPDPPTEFQKFVAATTGQVLPIYGENLFRNVPSTFAPVDLAPVTADYVVGPDDELRIHIWGQVNYIGNLRVDRSGDIYLPQVGTVHVAGLPFATVDQHLRAAVARIYRNFDLSVDIGQIRSMQIYVTGQARRPGVYTVSSLSSLVDALFASGGPSPQGSLRHIQLNRNGKTVADFDLYGLIIHGDKSHDARLLPGDVLYISPVGPQAAITGSINNPGIYELSDGETIRNLIDAAGKTSSLASNFRISLERLEQQQLRQAMEFGFDDISLAAPLADGDILRIYSVLPAYRKTVTLRGNVANPGRFSWRQDMHLSDLLPDRESLVSRDYWWKRSHLGLPAPEFEPMISTIGRDQRNRESTSQGFTTSVTQETLTAALARNDQQNINSSRPASEVARQDADQTWQDLVTVSATEPARPGQTGSSGSVASKFAQAPAGPGQRRRNDVRLSAPEINWNYSVIERVDENTLKSKLIPFDLGKLVLEHDAAQNLALEPGDTITVFSESDIRAPLDQQVKYVELQGEFVHAGFYSTLPGETLQELVRRAGGLTSRAYLYGSEFTRESTRVLQQQRLDEYVRTVTMESERGAQALAVSATPSANSSSDLAASRAVSQELTDRLSQIRATGRIVLQLQPSSAGISEVPAVGLENGDRFVVPSSPATVNVVGAVYNQNSFLYQPRQSVERYLRMAGGPNRNADWHHAFVIRADGSVISRAAAKGTAFWANSFNEMRLNPGDTIVMPDKTLRPAALRNALDWTQIFSQLALGAAAINVL
jgi:protein involved in polysaccharide export with SLBB domain